MSVSLSLTLLVSVSVPPCVLVVMADEPTPPTAPVLAAPESHKLAPFNPTAAESIAAALDLACVGPEDVVYDIGCGDGRLHVQ